MSNHLISTVYKRNLKTAMRKAVMVLLADKASDDGRGIYASKQTMADELCTSKQTVITVIKELLAEGLLKAVGQNKITAGYTVEYAINVTKLQALPLVKCHAERESRGLTGQAALPVKQDDQTSQAALPDQSSSFTQTLQEPSINPDAKASKRARDCFPCPDDVDPIDWSALKDNRKAKRAPLTEGAHRQIVNKLVKWADAGWPPGPVVAYAAERGWTTVFETDEMKAGQNGQLSNYTQRRVTSDGGKPSGWLG